MHSKWDDRWFGLAEHVSTWSKDPSRKIGAIIVDKNQRLLSMGWNGLPRGVEDTIERLENRELKYKMVVHAEMNALLNAGYNGVSLKDSTIYITGLPCCNECAKGIIQSGVSAVKMRYPDVSKTWVESFEISRKMFDEAKILHHTEVFKQKRP